MLEELKSSPQFKSRQPSDRDAAEVQVSEREEERQARQEAEESQVEEALGHIVEKFFEVLPEGAFGAYTSLH